MYLIRLHEKVNELNPSWKEQGFHMINQFTKLLDLLLDYRSVLTGDENRDKRMTCIANLLQFYKEQIYKKELYVKYIYKLYDLHMQAQNYAETGFTLRLHADLFSWSFSPVKEFTIHTENQISVQSTSDKLEWQRKEQLYLKIIDLFDKGKCWEEALPLLKELETFYDRNFEYQKLSSCIKKRAQFLDLIMSQFRLEPEYFRVAFYGQGFPLFLRNRMFVYKGTEYEKICDFTQKLQAEFPTAEILMKNNPPDQEMLTGPTQYIQVCTVKPIPELPAELEAHNNLNEKISEYYMMNQVRKFTFDRPIQKDPIDRENEFKSLWIERTTLTISKKLPGILRSFEVCDRQTLELSPVEHACDVIETMSKELKKLIVSYSIDPSKQLTPLTMRLQGVIEAAVNGGLSKYQEAFFDPKYIETNVNYYPHIKRLKRLIFNQISILEGGLSVHKRLVPSSLQPLHSLLVERFTAMKHSFISASSYIVDIGPNDKRPSILNTPLPPIPNGPRSNKSGYSNDGLNHGESNDADNIYSMPDTDGRTPPVPKRYSNGGSPPPIPPPSRPKSNAYSGNDASVTLGRMVHVIPINSSCSAQRTRSMPRNQPFSSPNSFNQLDTFSPNAHPPLPPRGNTHRMSTGSQDLEIDKPELPRRNGHSKPKMSEPNSLPASSDETGGSGDSPPPLPMKKRIPTSMSTTIITIGTPETETKGLLGSNLNGGSLFSNNFLNSNNLSLLAAHDSLKSVCSSGSTLSMSTSSSSTNEYSFSETHLLSANGAPLNGYSLSQSGRSESLQQQLQQLNLEPNGDN